MRIISMAAWVAAGWSRLTTVGFAPAEREELRAWWRSGQHELIAAGRARGRAPWSIAAALLWQLVVLSAPHDIGRWLRRVGLPGLGSVVAAGRRRRLPRAWRDWRDTVLFAVLLYGVGTTIIPFEPLTTLTRVLPAPLFWVVWISAAHPWCRLLRAAWQAAARRRAPGDEADQARPRDRAEPGTPRGTGSAAGGAARGGEFRYRRVGAAQRAAIRRRRAADRDPQAVGAPILWSSQSAAGSAGLPPSAALNWRLVVPFRRATAAPPAARPWPDAPAGTTGVAREPAAVRVRVSLAYECASPCHPHALSE